MTKPVSKRKHMSNPNTTHCPSNAQGPDSPEGPESAIPQPCPHRYLRTSCSRTSSQLRFSRVLKRLRETMQSWGEAEGRGERGVTIRALYPPRCLPNGNIPASPHNPSPTNHSYKNNVSRTWHIKVIQVLNK